MSFLLNISILCETFPNYAKETILSSLSDLEDRIGIPHFMTFGFIAPNRYCIIYKLQDCSNPAFRKSISAIFSHGIAHFMSLSNFGNFYNVSDFIIICYGDLRSMIFDITLVVVLGHHEPYH